MKLSVMLTIMGCAPYTIAVPQAATFKHEHFNLVMDMLLNLRLQPCYRWLEATGIEPIPRDHIAYYALIVKPEEPGRCPTLAIKFHLDWAHEGYAAHHYSDIEPWVKLEENPTEYATRVIAGIREQLRCHLLAAFSQNLTDQIETLTFGRSIFCRMPTEYSNPEKIRPEDIIFQH
jgi:hypothetical protein